MEVAVTECLHLSCQLLLSGAVASAKRHPAVPRKGTARTVVSDVGAKSVETATALAGMVVGGASARTVVGGVLVKSAGA